MIKNQVLEKSPPGRLADIRQREAGRPEAIGAQVQGAAGPKGTATCTVSLQGVPVLS